jgi:hypothetical protein
MGIGPLYRPTRMSSAPSQPDERMSSAPLAEVIRPPKRISYRENAIPVLVDVPPEPIALTAAT